MVKNSPSPCCRVSQIITNQIFARDGYTPRFSHVGNRWVHVRGKNGRTNGAAFAQCWSTSDRLRRGHGIATQDEFSCDRNQLSHAPLLPRDKDWTAVAYQRAGFISLRNTQCKIVVKISNPRQTLLDLDISRPRNQRTIFCDSVPLRQIGSINQSIY